MPCCRPATAGLTTDFKVAPLPARARPTLVSALASIFEESFKSPLRSLPAFSLRPLRFFRTSCFSSMKCPPPLLQESLRRLPPPPPLRPAVRPHGDVDGGLAFNHAGRLKSTKAHNPLCYLSYHPLPIVLITRWRSCGYRSKSGRLPLRWGLLDIIHAAYIKVNALHAVAIHVWFKFPAPLLSTRKLPLHCTSLPRFLRC